MVTHLLLAFGRFFGFDIDPVGRCAALVSLVLGGSGTVYTVRQWPEATNPEKDKMVFRYCIGGFLWPLTAVIFLISGLGNAFVLVCRLQLPSTRRRKEEQQRIARVVPDQYIREAQQEVDRLAPDSPL